MREMIFRLGDDHSSYLSPKQALEDDQMRLGEVDYVGIGVRGMVVPEKSSLDVVLVYPGSPAEQAGIKMHDNILAVDGQPAINIDEGIRRNLLTGPEGTTINVTVQSPGAEPRTIPITRQRVGGALPVPYSVLTTPQGKRIGYIFMYSFTDTTLDDHRPGAQCDVYRGPVGRVDPGQPLQPGWSQRRAVRYDELFRQGLDGLYC